MHIFCTQGLHKWQVQRRQSSRFAAYIKTEYGGSSCYHEFMRTGKLHRRKMTKARAPAQLDATKQLPQIRRRLLDLAQRQKKRDKYYNGVLQRLQRVGGAGPEPPNMSPWVRFHTEIRQWREHNQKNQENQDRFQ